MPIIRVSRDNHRRVISFKAWHKGLKRMVHVRACNFDSIDEDAELVFPDTNVSFRAQMRELVLLQDTNSTTPEGAPVYEGDIVLVEVQNIFGSVERATAEVMFDEGQWGYNLKFYGGSGLPLTGNLQVIAVLGNVFEGIDKEKEKLYDQQKPAAPNKK